MGQTSPRNGLSPEDGASGVALSAKAQAHTLSARFISLCSVSVFRITPPFSAPLRCRNYIVFFKKEVATRYHYIWFEKMKTFCSTVIWCYLTKMFRKYLNKISRIRSQIGYISLQTVQWTRPLWCWSGSNFYFYANLDSTSKCAAYPEFSLFFFEV